MPLTHILLPSVESLKKHLREKKKKKKINEQKKGKKSRYYFTNLSIHTLLKHVFHLWE